MHMQRITHRYCTYHAIHTHTWRTSSARAAMLHSTRQAVALTSLCRPVSIRACPCCFMVVSLAQQPTWSYCMFAHKHVSAQFMISRAQQQRCITIVASARLQYLHFKQTQVREQCQVE